jgi:hypothetical protein
MATHLITCTKITEHITHALYGLHWLPVNQRIAFIIITLTFKARQDLASPHYLTQLIRSYRLRHSLRSEKKDLLDLPKM